MIDFINFTFELGGVIFGYGNIVKIKEDKCVAGVYVPAVAFFALWGYWNVIFYSSLNQWWSLSAGILLAVMNTYWVLLMYKYKDNKENP